jgi:hypothetical protein
VKKPKHLNSKRIDFTLLVPDHKSYFTWHRRPRRSIDYKSAPSTANHDDTAIVLQGDLSSSSEFAIETTKMYFQNFPGVQVVVSTWQGTRKSDIEKLEKLGCTVVLSPIPESPGPYNRDLQLVSSNAGLKAGIEKGAKFLLKTRIDQRLYSPHALSLMKGLSHKFPISGPNTSQITRLVIVSNNTFISRIYGVSDFLTFGSSVDVLAYWDSLGKTGEPQELPEAFFCRSFLERSGWECNGTQEDWELVLRSRFIVVDGVSLDFFWNKYSSREMLWRRYGQIPHLEEVTFGGWLELMTKGDRV